METVAALEVIRHGLRVHDHEEPLLQLRGVRGATRYEPLEELMTDRMQAQAIPKQETSEAYLVADYLNEEKLPDQHAIPLKETILHSLWLRREHLHLKRSIGRLQVALQRAEDRNLLVLQQLDLSDVLTHYAGQYLASAALLRQTDRRGEVGLYISPDDLARLRTRFPDVRQGVFRALLDEYHRRPRLVVASLAFAQERPDMRVHPLITNFRKEMVLGSFAVASTTGADAPAQAS